jgi:hypothetical protein
MYEVFSLLDGNPATPPLTQVILHWVPWWVTMPFLAWLLWHFGGGYLASRRPPSPRQARDELYFLKLCRACGSYAVSNSPAVGFCSSTHPPVSSLVYTLGRYPTLDAAWTAAQRRMRGENP